MNVNLDKVAITAMGYITQDHCGAVFSKVHVHCSDSKEACRILEARGFLKGQSKNWGRFDAVSLTTYAAALWACMDAGFALDQGKRRIGVVASNEEGALGSNKAFFEDYVAAGRSSARSHLFIYTLPTTPIAEVALFCGFTGPLWYMHESNHSLGRLIEEAALCAAQEDVEGMLAVCAGPKEALCFVLQKSKERTLFSTSFVQEHLKNDNSVVGILQALGILLKEKDAR